MKTPLYLFATLSVILFSLHPLTAQTTFQKVIGGTQSDGAYSVVQTTDGGYTTAGATYSFGAGSEDIYLAHTDANGDLLWTKTFGETGNDFAHCVSQNSDGGYIISGYTNSFGASAFRCYLIRTDETGNHLWSNTYSGPNHSELFSVKQTPDGGFVSAGKVGSDAFLVKTDSSGNTQWKKVYGGGGTDIARSVALTSDGGYIITGYTSSFGAGTDDVYVIKTNDTGDTLWTKAYGGASNDYGVSIMQTNDGGYMLFGETSSFGNSSEYLLLRLNAAGYIVWSKVFGGQYQEFAASMSRADNGNILLSGKSQTFGAGYGDSYVVCLDSTGTLLWSKTFGNIFSDYGNCIIPTNDGGVLVAGESSTSGASGLGQTDMSLVKTNAVGTSGCAETSPATVSAAISAIISGTSTVVSTGGSVSNPATISNTGGTAQTICFSTGINDVDEAVTVSVFPNPVTSGFFINTNLNQQPEKIKMYSANGQLAMVWENIESTSHYFAVDKLPEGLYFLEIELVNNQVSYKKVSLVK
jgi:Secretion system C-terminal sorting domain